MIKRHLVIFFSYFLLCGGSVSLFCEQKVDPVWEKVTDVSKLPNFGAMSPQEKKLLVQSCQESLRYLKRSSSKFHYPKQNVTHEKVQKSLERFIQILSMNLAEDELDKKIKKEFVAYRSVGKPEKKSVLFTGYYEPVYKGSRKKTELYKYPLYKMPSDLALDKKGKVQGRQLKNGKLESRYWNRQEIDNQGVLNGRGLEIVYLDNPYDVYMAQFQGSVAVELSDGTRCHLGYKARNCSTVGFSLARQLLKDKNWQLSEALPSNIAQYFYKNPDELSFYLRKNPSYVFFTERKKGPMGALSVFLQGTHAVSTDHRIFPKAALAFVDLKLYKNKKNYPFQHFVLNQDTGGAIIGPGRCEIFFGTGKEAEAKASDMFSYGQLYFLFLKES